MDRCAGDFPMSFCERKQIISRRSGWTELRAVREGLHGEGPYICQCVTSRAKDIRKLRMRRLGGQALNGGRALKPAQIFLDPKVFESVRELPGDRPDFGIQIEPLAF